MLCEIVTSQAAKKRAFDLEELILDPWRGSQLSPEDKLLLESFPQLHVLSFIGCGLSSLSNFPELPRLTKLVLTNNNISTGLVGLRELCNLTQLNLSHNPIRYLPDLRPLTKLTSLISLDLSHCPVETCQFFREKMFVMLPFLEILDGMNKRGQAAEMTDDDDSEEDLPESLLEARKRVFEQRPSERPKDAEVIEIEDSETEKDAPQSEGSDDDDDEYYSSSDDDSPPPSTRSKTTQ